MAAMIQQYDDDGTRQIRTKPWSNYNKHRYYKNYYRNTLQCCLLIYLYVHNGTTIAQGQHVHMEGSITVDHQNESACLEKTHFNQDAANNYVFRMYNNTPNAIYRSVCPSFEVHVRLNDPCAWARGKAQLTTATFTGLCKGATRVIHWHHSADEWGYVERGVVQTFVASRSITSGVHLAGLPWDHAYNKIGERGVWFFPRGWLHGLTCLTPEEEGGCIVHIFFNGSELISVDNHNLDTTLAQTPFENAARALKVNETYYKNELLPLFKEAGDGSVDGETSPLVVQGCRRVSDEQFCPCLSETTIVPAAVNHTVEVEYNIADGVKVFQIRTDQFPFAQTMSQERTTLAAGALRPLVWTTNADAILRVIKGNVTIGLQGGLPGESDQLTHEFHFENISAGDAVYFPSGRAYYFYESTKYTSAEIVTVFNVGQWGSIELEEALQSLPEFAVMASLRIDNGFEIDPESSSSFI